MTAHAPATPSAGSKGAHIWALVLTGIGLFMVTLDNLVVTTALPVIRVDLGASVETLGWVVNAYTLAFAVLLIGIGSDLCDIRRIQSALDRFGERFIDEIQMVRFLRRSPRSAANAES